MADRSKIEWTDSSWNPIRARNLKTGKIGWHCEHATTGCEFCYAEGFNKRLGTGLAFKPGHRKDIEIFLDETMLTLPLRWKKPRKIFVCSMTDAFAEFVTDAMLDRMFAVMALAPQHTFQVLTKRAKRMRAYFAPGRERMQTRWLWAARDTLGYHADGSIPPQFPPANVWLGVSAERQQEADQRIPELLATPAAVRFVSLEPLLGHISLHALNLATSTPSDALRGVQCVPDDSAEGYHNEPMAKLDWVIVGGESGRDARAMHPDWARSLRDWCQACGVAFFFKQWGEWAPGALNEHREGVANDGSLRIDDPALEVVQMTRIGKAKAGRLLDGVEHNEFPKVPA